MNIATSINADDGVQMETGDAGQPLLGDDHDDEVKMSEHLSQQAESTENPNKRLNDDAV